MSVPIPVPGKQLKNLPKRVVEGVTFNERTAESAQVVDKPADVRPDNREKPRVSPVSSTPVRHVEGESPGRLGLRFDELEKLSYRPDRLRLWFSQNKTSSLELSFKAAHSFDVIFTPTGPRVLEKRCWLCDGQVEAETGLLFSTAYPMERVPYVAMDASIAVLSRHLRLGVRPELTSHDARVYLGVRWRF